jgi:hypothetical protein
MILHVIQSDFNMVFVTADKKDQKIAKITDVSHSDFNILLVATNKKSP